MECDVFYGSHPPYTGPGDRCSRNEIAAGTAMQFSILGISTTFFGSLSFPPSRSPVLPFRTSAYTSQAP